MSDKFDSSRTQTRIILVQDCLDTHPLLADALKSAADLQLLATFSDPLAALSYLRLHPVDVVVFALSCADACLPFIDTMRSVDPDIRIVMLLDKADADSAVTCFVAGANACFLQDAAVAEVLCGIRVSNLGCTTMSGHIANHVLTRLRKLVDIDNSSSSENIYKQPQAAASLKLTSDVKDIGVLSPREQEVLALIVRGYSNQDIADQLIVSLATAKAHVRSILTKLAVSDRTQAAVAAMRQGLV